MRIDQRVHLIGGGCFGLSHYCDANIYAIDCGTETVLVDAGCGIAPDAILTNLAAEGLPAPTHLLLTHSHWDHARGASALRKALGVRVVAHEAAERELVTGLWRGNHINHLAAAAVPPTPLDLTVGDGDTLRFGSVTISVIATPGHTADSLCFALSGDHGDALFTGDTLMGEGRLGTFSAETDGRALRDSIERLADRVVESVYPGHHAFTVHGGARQIAIARETVNSAWSVSPGFIPHLPTWWLRRDERLAHAWITSEGT